MEFKSNAIDGRRETFGLVLGCVGVALFSASLPFTHVAVRSFGVAGTSVGRAAIAGTAAAVILRVTRSPVPPRRLWRGLAAVVAGVVVGFPVCTALALQHAPAGHSAVVIGLLPSATAGWSMLRTGIRPSARYWAFALTGAGAIVALALSRGSGAAAAHAVAGSVTWWSAVRWDAVLLAAVAFAAVGYAEGALVSREIGGWQTISWAAALGLPFSALGTAAVWHAAGNGPWQAPAAAWVALAYLGIVSSLVAFFAWYAGLAAGGIARVSQVQLLQPTLSLVWSTTFLGERLDAVTIVVTAVVLVSVAGSRRAAVG